MNCGSEGRSDDLFCLTCGAKLCSSDSNDAQKKDAGERAVRDRAEHWFSIGKALMVLHKYEDAMIYFNRSLRESPDYERSLRSMEQCRSVLEGKDQKVQSGTDVNDQKGFQGSPTAEKSGSTLIEDDINTLNSIGKITERIDADTRKMKSHDAIEEDDYLEDIEIENIGHIEIGPLEERSGINNHHRSDLRDDHTVTSRNPQTDDTLARIRQLRDLTRSETERSTRGAHPLPTMKPRDEYYSLASEAKKRGSLDAALELIEMGLSIYTNDPGLLGLKGEILGRKKDYTASLKCFDMALEGNPGDAGLQTMKGIALFQLGDYLGSLKCCEKALDIDPNNEQAKRGRLACQNRI